MNLMKAVKILLKIFLGRPITVATDSTSGSWFRVRYGCMSTFFMHFSMQVESLQWANLSSKVSYQMPIKRFRNPENRIGLSCHKREQYFRHKGKHDKAAPITGYEDS